MKIVCDVCGEEEAAVFCCADEAALCEPCDRRVHRANKLASKHRRFSLLSPSSSSPSPQSHPVCDVCQERRGFIFCQEDRAILCRDCDVPIHSANHLTMRHNRFLLTGVRLSSAPISSSSPEVEEVVARNDTSNHGKSVPKGNQDKALAADDPILCSSSSDRSVTTSTFTATATATAAAANPAAGNSSTVSGSSISDYLIKMCPGWRVEDLLVDDAAAAAVPFAANFFEKTATDELLPYTDADLQDGAGLEGVVEEFPIWVPLLLPTDLPAVPGGATATAAVVHCHRPWVPAKDLNSVHNYHGAKAVGRERWSDDAFTVPQVSPASSNPGKRPTQQSLWLS